MTNLAEIKSWANRGTLEQFALELTARLREHDEYQVRRSDDRLTIEHVSKEGGFLGLGAQEEKETVLEVRRDGERNIVRESSADREFVAFLAGVLSHH
jgi:hypothetical protein